MRPDTYHLLNTLGIRKAAIARSLATTGNQDENWQKAQELMTRRTQSYTIEELRLLLGFYLTASDECADEFPDDYTPLEVYTSRAKIARYDVALAVLSELAEGPGYPTTVGKLRLVLEDNQATMTGGAGDYATYRIYRSGQPREQWAKRVKAHWEGYCHNNGEK